MNVLFIGNSYTYCNDLDQIFQQLARDNGKQVDAYRVTKGGRRLYTYKDAADAITQQLENVLRQRHYDACFIQEQSLLPVRDYESFLSGLTHVVGMVGDRADKLYLYATWGRKQGSKDLEENGWTPQSMTALLAYAYARAARQIDATVSPVGENFLKVISGHPEIDLHTADLSHPSYAGSCLAALTHYHTLVGEFPENTGALALDANVMEIFRAAVCL